MRLAWIPLASMSIALAACGGSAPVGPDATIYCARTIYDPCMSEHDCADTMCETLSASLQVCTQTCTPGDSSCPMKDGEPVTCGSGGFCEPDSPTMCTLNPP